MMPAISCAGYCYAHCPENIKSKYKSKKDLQIKSANARKYASTKLRMTKYAEDTELELWFRRIALEIEKNPYCWETGAYISKNDYRNATSHIFPKSVFLSVATHPMNYLILSPRNGSHDKTHRIDTFSKMKVFSIAIERFYLFEKEITEHHKYLNLFKEAIKNYKQ
jgi:hypothetical protein